MADYWRQCEDFDLTEDWFDQCFAETDGYESVRITMEDGLVLFEAWKEKPEKMPEPEWVLGALREQTQDELEWAEKRAKDLGLI